MTLGNRLRECLRRLTTGDDEPEDSAEIKAREEILQHRKKRLRTKIANYRNQGNGG